MRKQSFSFLHFLFHEIRKVLHTIQIFYAKTTHLKFSIQRTGYLKACLNNYNLDGPKILVKLKNYDNALVLSVFTHQKSPKNWTTTSIR